jgi:hypothetical protein
MPGEDENNPIKKFTSPGQITGSLGGAAIASYLSHVLGIPAVDIIPPATILGSSFGDFVQRQVEQRTIKNANAKEQQELLERAQNLRTHITDELDQSNDENRKLVVRLEKGTRDVIEGNLTLTQFRKDIEKTHKAYRKAADLD